MGLLSREQILSANDLDFEEVDIPEWGGNIRIRCMTGKQRDTFEAEITDQKGKDIKVNIENLRSKLLVRCIVDENNNPVFNETDIEALAGKNSRAIDKAFGIAQKINGIGQKEVEELTKN